MQFRTAQQTDLVEIVKMLADDPLGSSREEFSNPPKPCYLDAFRHIEADPNNDIIVAVDTDGELLGCFQLTYIPNLTLQGSWRAQLEGVRVKASKRSAGIGKALIEHAIQSAQTKGCRTVKLTSNIARIDALRCYESLGFTPSHISCFT
jgi:GNAT superfamily N-acetyltransferase